MPDPNDSPLGPLAPGFEFLQGLAANAKSALPGIGQWMAPTLNPEEIDRRISELRSVQFWLEQNARLIATTIQGLEVQRMTLATLKTMNLPANALRESLQARPSPSAAGSASRDSGAPAAPVADPVQWWGELTQQFTQLASSAMRDAMKDAGAAARAAAGRVAASPESARTGPRVESAAPPPAARRAAPRRSPADSAASAPAPSSKQGAGRPASRRPRGGKADA